MHPLLADASASASLTRLMVPWSRNEHLQGLAPEAAAVQRYDPEIRTYTFSASVRLAAGTPRGARTMAGRWAWGHRSSGRGQHVDYGRARWRRCTFLQGASRARRQARQLFWTCNSRMQCRHSAKFICTCQDFTLGRIQTVHNVRPVQCRCR